MTHKEIVDLCAKWLKRHKRNATQPNCTLILKELVALNHSGEIPDVLGFNYWTSVMIEVKCSRYDFLNDKNKRYKKFSIGAGEFKYYCCPERVIFSSEVPEGYGLLWIDENGYIDFKKDAKRGEADYRTERSMLLSHIRRLNDKIKHIEK